MDHPERLNSKFWFVADTVSRTDTWPLSNISLSTESDEVLSQCISTKLRGSVTLWIPTFDFTYQDTLTVNLESTGKDPTIKCFIIRHNTFDGPYLEKQVEDLKATKNIKTCIYVDLPYALFGLPRNTTFAYDFSKNYEYKDIIDIKIEQIIECHFKPVAKNTQAAASNLGFEYLLPRYQDLCLVPDNRGLVNVTGVVLVFSEHIDISYLEEPKSKKLAALKHLLANVLNPLLSAYSYLTDNYYIYNLSGLDFTQLAAWHTAPKTIPYFNYKKVLLQDCNLLKEKYKISPDDQLQKNIMEYFSLDKYYQDSRQLLIQARRAFEANDHTLAAILGMTSLEVALPHFLKKRIEMLNADGSKPRMTWKDYEDTKKDVSFAFLLKSIFPLVLAKGVEYPLEVVRQCNSLRKKRNKAVHDRENFTNIDKAELDAIDYLIKFMISYHNIENFVNQTYII